ncbi:myosin heavy fast skeletal muscle-like protein [Labeo rohita]|uniref:Myosin heavy fast skeletal muscle-like protein n=1 Tax=Labeo rohita TaxID=84645 RepID=A0A498MMB4_LABRO|nr:myosin heavy fast skeletal muscle-like protein [Labeo rohita]
MMAAPQKFMLHVYIATDIAVKVTLTGRPESVDDLIAILREKVKPRLDFEFTLQYEDADFNGQLSCLIDIQELPEKGTLKVVRSESDAGSLASSDTEILPHVPVCAEFHRITNTNLRNQFYAELDRHTPQLFALYRQKASHTGKVSEVLRDILRIYDREVEESDEPDITGTPLALVMKVTENTGPVCFNPARTAVVLQYRLVAYRMVTEWALKGEKLGKGHIRVLPSCVVDLIRTKYPSPNGQYQGFKESEEAELLF